MCFWVGKIFLKDITFWIKAGVRKRGEGNLNKIRELGSPFYFLLVLSISWDRVLCTSSCTLLTMHFAISHKRSMVSIRAKILWGNKPKNSWKVTVLSMWTFCTILATLIDLTYVRDSGTCLVLYAACLWCKTHSMSHQFTLKKTFKILSRLYSYLLKCTKSCLRMLKTPFMAEIWTSCSEYQHERQ